MSKFLTIASGWFHDEYQTLYCKSKGEHGNLYDTETKKGEKVPLTIIVRNENGEELEVTDFRVVENTRRENDKHPTHEIKVKLD